MNHKLFYPERPDLHTLKSDWYYKHLKVLEEPSIYQLKSIEERTIIRFTWLRTFDQPISIRLIVNEDESGILYVKMSNGKGGYEPGTIVINERKDLLKQTVASFINTIENMNFWNLPSTTEQHGFDGSQWIFEGLSGGEYHVVERWSPESGAIKNLGLMFLKISGLEDQEIY
jgi:hypothetical protein